MDQKPRYRRGVGMIILNSKNQIFIGQRFDKDKSAWQMPQGGIDKGESPAGLSPLSIPPCGICQADLSLSNLCPIKICFLELRMIIPTPLLYLDIEEELE